MFVSYKLTLLNYQLPFITHELFFFIYICIYILFIFLCIKSFYILKLKFSFSFLHFLCYKFLFFMYYFSYICQLIQTKGQNCLEKLNETLNQSKYDSQSLKQTCKIQEKFQGKRTISEPILIELGFGPAEPLLNQFSDCERGSVGAC